MSAALWANARAARASRLQIGQSSERKHRFTNSAMLIVYEIETVPLQKCLDIVVPVGSWSEMYRCSLSSSKISAKEVVSKRLLLSIRWNR
jgi:hypothetical protein